MFEKGAMKPSNQTHPSPKRVSYMPSGTPAELNKDVY